MKILLVEDNADLLESLRDRLSPQGWEIITAIDGIDAQEKLAQEVGIDIILSDNDMPRLNGMKLLVYAKEKYSRIGFILMSGDKDSRDMALSIGADGFIQKPSERKTYIEEIERVFKKKKGG